MNGWRLVSWCFQPNQWSHCWPIYCWCGRHRTFVKVKHGSFQSTEMFDSPVTRGRIAYISKITVFIWTQHREGVWPGKPSYTLDCSVREALSGKWCVSGENSQISRGRVLNYSMCELVLVIDICLSAVQKKKKGRKKRKEKKTLCLSLLSIFCLSKTSKPAIYRMSVWDCLRFIDRSAARVSSVRDKTWNHKSGSL